MFYKINYSLLLIVLMSLTAILFSEDKKTANTGIVIDKQSYEFSKPITHKNLTLFLITGKSNPAFKDMLTLEESIKNKKLIVHETGNVNQLSVENKSDKQIFIQAGDIIKGGKQDRTFQHDLVLQPNSGKVSIASFCVEQGRWSKRQGESLQTFAISDNNLCSNDLKLAVRSAGDQSKVWKSVSKSQKAISLNMSIESKAKKSPSSLQLTLENKKLKAEIKTYKTALLKQINTQDDVLGFAFYINGKVTCIDIYPSTALYKKLENKMIDACITEAIASLDKQQKGTKVPTVTDIQTFITTSEKGKFKKDKATTNSTHAQNIIIVDNMEGNTELNKDSNIKNKPDKKQKSKGTGFINYKKDNKSSVIFESRTQKGLWVRRNYLAK